MKSTRVAPIGVFDSGVGGLTVWKEIVRLLPAEDTFYLADSANAPYGDRSSAEILELSRRNTEWLLEKGCKIIVVACNTATTNAIAQLRASYPVPFIGIEPAIKPAALHSKSGKIGVLATRGTLSSELFAHTSKNYGRSISILEREGKGLVRAIENGQLAGPALRSQLADLLSPLVEAGIDHLVLGCTHYPFLSPILSEVLPREVRILDCGLPVARQTRSVLKERDLLSESGGSSHRMYTSGDPTVMNNLLKSMGYSLTAEAY